jgi:hypothetical protein
MAAGAEHDHISRKRIVYALPETNQVIVRKDQEYARDGAGPLTMDLYYPPAVAPATSTPAVLFVTGYRDAGAARIFGCRLKEMGSYVSWAELVAASGLVGVTYANEDPVFDAHHVLEHVRRNAPELGIDANRLAIWSCSGNVPNALSLLMRRPAGVKCAALWYGYMLDTDAKTGVADAARQFGFVNPCSGKSVDDLPRDVPLFIVRAGRDEMPGLNDTIDLFVCAGLQHNLPITLVNRPDAPHAFDLFSDDQASRDIIAQGVEFLRSRLA